MGPELETGNRTRDGYGTGMCECGMPTVVLLLPPFDAAPGGLYTITLFLLRLLLLLLFLRFFFFLLSSCAKGIST